MKEAIGALVSALRKAMNTPARAIADCDAQARCIALHAELAKPGCHEAYLKGPGWVRAMDRVRMPARRIPRRAWPLSSLVPDTSHRESDMRLLVAGADDDRDAWIEWALLDEDVAFYFTSSGGEGAAHAKLGNFDLILLDPHGPGRMIARQRCIEPVVICH